MWAEQFAEQPVHTDSYSEQVLEHMVCSVGDRCSENNFAEDNRYLYRLVTDNNCINKKIFY